MDLFSNLLSDYCRLLHTDQVYLKTPNESVLTTVNGENGHNDLEINEPIANFKQVYELLNYRLLSLNLPYKRTCLEQIALHETVDYDEDEIACAVSLIPGQLGLIEEIITMCAAYPTYECEDFLKCLNKDTCTENFCIGKEMVAFDDGKDIDIPVLQQPFVYYPLVRKVRKQSIDIKKYLDKLINYVALYEKTKDENIPLKCFLCTMFARNNKDLIIGKSGDPVQMVRYLNTNFIDFYTPLESISIHRNNLFSRIEICL